MLQKLSRPISAEEGFTLIELLVVILIIGILAAIAIPSFLNQRSKANDTNAIADTRTARTAMETYAVANDGFYTGVSPADLVAIESSLTTANVLTAVGVLDTGYTVSVKSKGTSGGGVFAITRSATGIVRTCTVHGKGSCHVAADANGNYW